MSNFPEFVERVDKEDDEDDEDDEDVEDEENDDDATTPSENVNLGATNPVTRPIRFRKYECRHCYSDTHRYNGCRERITAAIIDGLASQDLERAMGAVALLESPLPISVSSYNIKRIVDEILKKAPIVSKRESKG